MRLRASFTVENAFIVPLFTLIIAAMMSLCLYLRDTITEDNAIIIASMKLEQELDKNDAKGRARVIADTKEYIDDNVIMLKKVMAEDIDGKVKGKRLIKDNYQPDFIRLINAGAKLKELVAD